MVKELFTKAGQQAIAKAIADKTTLKITRIAVGDGGGATYTPTEEQTALKGQKWSGELNRIVVNPENEKQLICEGLIAPGVGGFYIREVGLFDENNVLIAVSDFPESFKAAADQYELYVRMILEVSNTDVTNIIVKKDMVYATKEYVDNVVNSSGIAEELAAHKADETAHGVNTKMPIEGGMFTGITKAFTNTSYTVAQMRNVIISTATPTSADGSNGDIWIKY